MRVFRESDEPDVTREALTFALGALGGLALGMLISRRPAPRRVGRFGDHLRQRARSVARRLRPARLRRPSRERFELTALEDAVLDAFLADRVLSERGVDIGAISTGIVELSGSVRTEDEADHAVHLANSVPGVRTVVNRLDIEDEVRHLERSRRRSRADEDTGPRELDHLSGRVGGMGRRRQGRETDPDRPDDGQRMGEDALADADRDQWEVEGYAARPTLGERPEAQRARRTRYRADQLDNQDPHGKHARTTLDEQPQELNTDARVGEGLKPGVELRLEDRDVPLKPHSNRENPDE